MYRSAFAAAIECATNATTKTQRQSSAVRGRGNRSDQSGDREKRPQRGVLPHDPVMVVQIVIAIRLTPEIGAGSTVDQLIDQADLEDAYYADQRERRQGRAGKEAIPPGGKTSEQPRQADRQHPQPETGRADDDGTRTRQRLDAQQDDQDRHGQRKVARGSKTRRGQGEMCEHASGEE
jgi:hypothetical protein